MTTLVDRAYQADWIEADDGDSMILCVTNSVSIFRPGMRFLGGAQDQYETPDSAIPDWSVFVGLSIRFGAQDRPEIRAFNAERAAFDALRPTLERSHRGQFVAIHGGAAVDFDTSRDELIKRFFAQFGDVPVYVGYIGESPVVYQVTPFQL
jgi:hypothetical protein